jgi:hypothetical protein
MSDETQERQRYGFWVGLALVLAPLLYTLSGGLAAYLVGEPARERERYRSSTRRSSGCTRTHG